MADPNDKQPQAEPSTPSAGAEWRKQLESHLKDAKALGGEIKDRLAQAGKKASAEAKDAWKQLEPQIEGAEKTLKEAADGAAESLQGLFGELKGQLGKLRDRL